MALRGREFSKKISEHVLGVHRWAGWRAEREVQFDRRRIDVLAIARGGSSVIGYEIKISLADFANELKDNQKRGAVMPFCSEFYFVCPRGVIPEWSIPPGCGLVYVHVSNGWRFEVVKRSGDSSEYEIPLETWTRAVVQRERDEKELEEKLDAEIADVDVIDSIQLPEWLLPRYRKPLKFDFDVFAAAETMVAAALPEFEIDLEMVPF